MFIHDKSLVTIPDFKLHATMKNGVRFYFEEEHPDITYPSITAVLSANPKKQAGLAAWRKRIGKENAARVTRVAAKQGTSVHKICEDYIDNKPNYLDGAMPDAIALFNSVKPHLDKHLTKIYAQEVSMFSKQLGVAGRVDLIAEWDDVPVILDFKTSNKPKQPEWVYEHYMQCAGYAAMFYEMTGYPIRDIVVVIAVPELKQPPNFRGESFSMANTTQETNQTVQNNQFSNMKVSKLIAITCILVWFFVSFSIGYKIGGSSREVYHTHFVLNGGDTLFMPEIPNDFIDPDDFKIDPYGEYEEQKLEVEIDLVLPPKENAPEFVCLAKTIYFEARNQSYAGMLAVGTVVMNRVMSHRYPDTICGVVRQKHQFSWYWDGKPDIPNESASWEEAKSAAKETITGKALVYDEHVMHYHADYVNPVWASTLIQVAQIDNHIFYR